MRPIAVALTACIVALASASRADDAVRPEQRTVARAQPPSTSAFGNALRLARMLNDDRTIAMLVAARGSAQNATDEEVAQAVDAYENLGDPTRAIELLKKRIARMPKDKTARVMLAELYERDGKSADAAATWASLDSPADPFALTVAQVTSYARDLARAGNNEAAFAVLKSHAPAVSEDATEFWIELGTLAWLFEDEPSALSAYRHVWAVDQVTPNVGTRLMTLAQESGFFDEAITVAVAEYGRSKEPATLLFAANIQAEQRDWAGAQKTLGLALADASGFERREEYWMLRAEVAAELGDQAGSVTAFKKALELRPNNTTAQAAVLSHDLDRDDVAAINVDLERFKKSARVSPELWGPFAAALQRTGRSQEALEFILRDWRSHPDDESATFELADALDDAGATQMAARLRRHAMGNRQALAVAALHAAPPKAEEITLLADHVAYVRDRAGVAMGERWLDRALAAHRSEARVSQLALDTYLADERWERARLVMRRMQSVSLEARMDLAVADSDYGEVRRLLAMPALASPKWRAEGYELLERDADELPALRAAWTSEPEADKQALAQRIRELEARHAPSVSLGGGYAYINGLGAAEANVGASHDLGALRVVYTGSGGDIAITPGFPAIDTLRMTRPRAEAALGVLLRHTDFRGVTELGLGVDYQPDRPVPRATLLDEHLFGRVVSTRVELSLDERIEDTPWLRLEGARSHATVGVRADYVKRLYTSLEVGAFEDHTRLFQHLSVGGLQSFETGVKLLKGQPEWDIGVQAEAVQRRNTGQGLGLSDDALNAWRLTRIKQVTKSDVTLVGVDSQECAACYLPESYQVIEFVTHLTRGDFTDRYRADRRSFPRYDCDAGVGIIFPSLEGAVHVACSASFRVVGKSFVSASASYDRGVAGSDEQNAHANASFTQPF